MELFLLFYFSSYPLAFYDFISLIFPISFLSFTVIFFFLHKIVVYLYMKIFRK